MFDVAIFDFLMLDVMMSDIKEGYLIIEKAHIAMNLF